MGACNSVQHTVSVSAQSDLPNREMQSVIAGNRNNSSGDSCSKSRDNSGRQNSFHSAGSAFEKLLEASLQVVPHMLSIRNILADDNGRAVRIHIV